MDQRRQSISTTTTAVQSPPLPPPEYSISIFSDPGTLNALLTSVLHTIFFHRYFPNVRPSTHNVLHLTLPYVDAPELTQLIDTRVFQLSRQLNSTSGPNTSVRGGIGVQFFEKRRRKTVTGATTTMMNLFGVRGTNNPNEEEVCWEIWRVEVTLAMPRTQEEQKKVTRAMETSLQKTIMKIIATANSNTDHIPPITTSEVNPFPYQIILNPKSGSVNG